MYPENYNMLETFICHLSSLITPPYPTTRLQWICPSRGHAPPSALNAMRPSPCGQGSISLAVVLFFPKRKSKYHSLPLPHRPRGGKHTVNFYSSPPPTSCSRRWQPLQLWQPPTTDKGCYSESCSGSSLSLFLFSSEVFFKTFSSGVRYEYSTSKFQSSILNSYCRQ